MLLGFKRRFAEYVSNGSKTHTIRATRLDRSVKVGDRVDCYVDPRQKTMRLLGRWPVVKVDEIRIDINGANYSRCVSINGHPLDQDEADLLAWRDGFRHPPLNEREGLGYSGCFDLMMEFWKGRLPFKGTIIHWDFNKPMAGPTSSKLDD